MTEKEFLKSLFNAKSKAEEEYRSTELPKITLFPWQCDLLEEYFPESHSIHEWLSANFDVQVQNGPDIQTIQAKIYADLREAQSERMNTFYKFAQGRGKTWLGSQWHERERERLQRGNRVEKVFEVPGIRGFGYSTDQAWIDEPYNLSVQYHGYTDWGAREESDVALETWLQRRGICYRASSCGLS